jgi:hypothetical protein
MAESWRMAEQCIKAKLFSKCTVVFVRPRFAVGDTQFAPVIAVGDVDMGLKGGWRWAVF